MREVVILRRQSIKRLQRLHRLLLITCLLAVGDVIVRDKFVESRRSEKKKVVIIGEMADIHELMSNSSNRYANYNGVDDLMVRRRRRPAAPQRSPFHASETLFIPVAAYSVTQNRVPGASNTSPRRINPSEYLESSSSPLKTTESAVYGYVPRPEIVEFRGQYFYGPNHVAASSSSPQSVAAQSVQTLQTPVAGVVHKNRLGGLGPGGLLLATLPLLLAPMLSYLFTPMIIPVTATIAAGRKRKKRNVNATANGSVSETMKEHNTLYSLKQMNENILSTPLDAKKESNTEKEESRLKEVQVVADYLRKVHFDERDRDKAIANYLQCDGMLDSNDHCLERLSCEFSDPRNRKAPQLDREVTSILLGHLLNNDYITNAFKNKLKKAAVFGRDYSGHCDAYPCSKVLHGYIKSFN